MTGWVLWTLVATASGQRIEVAIDFVAPEVCPPRARFAAELQARSDRLRVVEGGAAQATVSLTITERKKRFVGSSKVRTTLSGVTAREFKSARCETLVQAAALATSLLLDPEGTRTGEVTVTLTPGPSDAGAPEPVDAGLPSVEVDAGVAEPPLDAGRPEPEFPTPVDAGVTIDAGAPAPSPVMLELAVGGGLHPAISGALDGVVQLTVALQWSRFRLALSPQFVPGRRVGSANGVMQYLGVGGRLDALLSFPVAFLRFEGGLQVTVLGVPVAAPEAEVPGRAVGWVVAPGPFGRIVFLVGPLRLAVEGGAGVSLSARRFDIAGAGPVFSMPRPFGLLGGAVGWAF
jgi:hypothetical protein